MKTSRLVDPLVSVIIPNFNGEPYIEEAITSVFMQKAPFLIELIIVDDGSTDGSLEIIKRLQNTYVDIKLIELKENTGKGFAVGAGYDIALGKYVQILDADDYLLCEEKFQIQVDFMESNPSFCASAHNTLVFGNNQQNILLPDIHEDTDFSYMSILKFEFYCHTSSVLVRRLEGGLDKRFRLTESLRGDSAFLYYHAFALKGPLHFFSMVGSAYRIHEKGIWSRLTPNEKLQLHKMLFVDLQEIVVKDPLSQEHKWLNEKLSSLN